jgi:hypothetical protein
MATRTLPHVVPFPQTVPEVEQINQTELQLLLSLRGRLKQLESEIATEEESLKTRLEAGAVIEPGNHCASLKENSRRSVPWKEVVCKLAVRLGYDPDAYTSRVLSATKPTRTVSLEVY